MGGYSWAAQVVGAAAKVALIFQIAAALPNGAEARRGCRKPACDLVVGENMGADAVGSRVWFAKMLYICTSLGIPTSTMQILIDLSILRHPYCGLGQVALNYGRWYAAHGHEAVGDGHSITLLVPRSFVGQFGQHVHYLTARRIYRLMPWLMPTFDLWHSMHQMSPYRPLCGRTRRILTVHDVNFMYEKTLAKQEKYRARLQRDCDCADVLCFISEFAKADTLRRVDAKNKPTHVIYNGVEHLVQGQQKQPPAVSTSRPFFLSIGEVKPKKNIHTLLPLMDLLPDYQLVVAGNAGSSYAQQLRQQLLHHPNVLMLGTVTDDERRWLYAHCAGLLFPSLSEGFGLPVIEAMQWGKPVFCSNRTSLPEVGGPYAHYFDSFEPEHMAAVVRCGMASFDPQRAQQEQAYAATFGYERHMQQYWELYCCM